MANKDSSQNFDCIRFVRDVRARIAEETAGMSNTQRVEYYRNYPISDPSLRKLVAQARKGRQPRVE